MHIFLPSFVEQQLVSMSRRPMFQLTKENLPPFLIVDSIFYLFNWNGIEIGLRRLRVSLVIDQDRLVNRDLVSE